MAYDAAPQSDYTDEDLLAIVKSERARSIGFDLDSELTEQREQALNYLKGDMSEDMPSLPNRSKAVSTDVADAVETVLPDLMDILTGGEDIASFKAISAQDEQAAEQETDYVLHVLMEQNPGFTILYSMVKDALEVKTGVATWWIEETKAPEPEAFRSQSEAAVMMAQLDGELIDLRPAEEPSEDGQPLYDFEMQSEGPKRKVKIAAVSPDDFTVAADTVMLRDATYCAMRTRPRAQDLLKEGIDADIVSQLPAFEVLNTEERQARDTVGEHEKWDAAGAVFDLRQVEVVASYIRLLDGDETVIWRVLTGGTDSVLVKREIVNRIPFAAITPYLVPHRFYGLSVADKLAEIQRIRTALMRMGLDAGYFALNQRNEVAMDSANEFTVPDLLRNEPGMPIRSKSGGAVKPVQAGALAFDAFGAMETFAKVGEERTGIMRYGQGLKADTLHDTMGGAMVQLNSSQKRVRLMARLFAETGIKDLLLGIHALLRENGCKGTAKLKNKWIEVDPTDWGSREQMTIEIGVGSAGRDHDMMAMDKVIEMQAKAVEAQGGVGGPLVTMANLYASATKRARLSGLKAPEMFFSDPAAQQAPAPPQPSPDVIKAQAEGQYRQGKLQIEAGELQLKQQQAQHDAAIDLTKLQHEEADREASRQLAAAKLQFDIQNAADDRATNQALKLTAINAQFKTSVTVAQIKEEAAQFREQMRTGAEVFRAHADLLLQANDHMQEHHLAEAAAERAAERPPPAPEPAP